MKQLDWDTHTSSIVRVYRNLNNGTMSVQAKDGKSWKVVGHITECVLSSVTFKVQEGSRQRVIKDKQKNVHAWAQGVLICPQDDRIIAPIALGYDPYTDANFLDKRTGAIVTGCSYLVVRNNVVFLSQDAVQSEQPSSPQGSSIGSNLLNLFTQHQFAFAA